MKNRLFFGILFTILLLAHLCHSGILWAEEGLPLAAAQQMLFGRTLYRDIWFDKPPLLPLFYLLWGAKIGWLLRVVGALYCLACCYAASVFARRIWGEREGLWAAALLGVFLIFDTPAAVLPLAADMLTVLPHLAAVYLASLKKPFWSGVFCSLAFLTNVKAALVLVSCFAFVWPSVPLLLAGFAVPTLVVCSVLFLSGAWPNYIDQVWRWPAAYASSSHVSNPFGNGSLRVMNWLGFHAGLAIPAVYALRTITARWKWVLWIALSLIGVAIGGRFFPRYFLQLLPVAVLLAARGMALLPLKARWAVLALLFVPLVRFGPRYPLLALDLQPSWTDTAMDRESHAAADAVLHESAPGQTLYVWGFRPDIFAYTRMSAASLYLDSQALTGVPADRHLSQSTPVPLPGLAEARARLVQSSPDYIVDGLSLYNPRLAMQNYAELRPWIARYHEFGRRGNTILYRKQVTK